MVDQDGKTVDMRDVSSPLGWSGVAFVLLLPAWIIFAVFVYLRAKLKSKLNYDADNDPWIRWPAVGLGVVTAVVLVCALMY
jgi:hypothetical protein